MSRRVRLPGADELFRPTRDGEQPAESEESADQVPQMRVVADDAGVETAAETGAETGAETDPDAGADHAAAEREGRRSSGRVRHDEKMTVYVTADELFDLESARLTLRRDLGVAVDRGRLVREAIAIVLADLDDHGGDSVIARRLAAS